MILISNKNKLKINNWNPNFVSEKPDWLRSDFLKFRLGSLGCLLSHVEIMKISLERGYEQILILTSAKNSKISLQRMTNKISFKKSKFRVRRHLNFELVFR